MKLAVVGSRNLKRTPHFNWVLGIYLKHENLTEIVSGGALGIDTAAHEYAQENDVPIKVFSADWIDYGKRAGYIRNNDIWQYADEGVAFWDGKSKGTAHSFYLAKKYKKTLIVFQDEMVVKIIKHGKTMSLD